MRRLLLLLMLLSSVAATSVESAETHPSPPTSQPATQPHQIRFTSMMDILNKTPEELRPRATGEWHKFTEAKFIAWLNQQMTGMAFDQEIQYAGGTVMQNIYKHAPGKEWMVYPNAYPHPFSCFGTTHKWSTTLPLIFTDETGAKKWSAYKPGTRMRLTGTIKSVGALLLGIGPKSSLQFNFQIFLQNAELTPPK